MFNHLWIFFSFHCFIALFHIKPCLYLCDCREGKHFPTTLRVPGWVWTLNWQRQINRTKHTNLFHVSFPWHGSLHKETKFHRNRPECFVPGLVTSGQCGGIWSVKEYEVRVVNWGSGDACSDSSQGPFFFRDKGALFPWVQGGHLSQRWPISGERGRGKGRVTFLLLLFPQTPSA